MLRLADESDYLMLDTGTDVLDASSPPGRAVLDGKDVQVAVLGGLANVAEQAKAIDKLAATLRAGVTRRRHRSAGCPKSFMPPNCRRQKVIGWSSGWPTTLSARCRSNRAASSSSPVHRARGEPPHLAAMCSAMTRSRPGLADLLSRQSPFAAAPGAALDRVRRLAGPGRVICARKLSAELTHGASPAWW